MCDDVTGAIEKADNIMKQVPPIGGDEDKVKQLQKEFKVSGALGLSTYLYKFQLLPQTTVLKYWIKMFRTKRLNTIDESFPQICGFPHFSSVGFLTRKKFFF
jgi:hypothetical protein